VNKSAVMLLVLLQALRRLSAASRSSSTVERTSGRNMGLLICKCSVIFQQMGIRFELEPRLT